MQLPRGQCGPQYSHRPRPEVGASFSAKELPLQRAVECPAPLGFPERAKNLQLHLQQSKSERRFPEPPEFRQTDRRSAHGFARRSTADESDFDDSVLSPNQEGALSLPPLLATYGFVISG